MKAQFPNPAKREQNATVAFQNVDLTFQASPNFERVTGQSIPIRGDWLYVDPASTGTLRADLYSQGTTDIQSLHLSAGVLFEGPFTAVRLFQPTILTTPAITYLNAGAQSIIVDPPSLRIFYGTGKAPFSPPTETRGSAMLTPSAMNLAATSVDVSYLVTEGMRIRHAMLGVTGFAGTATNFRASLTFLSVFNSSTFTFSPGAGRNFAPIIPPDIKQGYDATATVALDMLFAWRDIVIPRNVGTIRLFANTEGVGPGSLAVISAAFSG